MKKLRRENKKLPVGSTFVIKYFFVYIILVFCLVSVIMYVPNLELDKKEVEATEETYSSQFDEVLIDGSNITCSSETKKNVINNISKIDIRYSFTSVVGDELEENMAWDGLDESDHYIYPEYYAFLFSFINLPKDVKVIVYNNYNDEVVEFDNNDIKNGKYEFTTLDIDEVILYTVSVYTTNAECNNELIRQFSFNMPRYNYSYFSNSCINNSAKECDLLTYDEEGEYVYSISIEDIEKNVEELEKNEKEKEEAKNKNHYSLLLAIGITIIIVVVSFLFFVIFVKVIDKRRKKRNETL